MIDISRVTKIGANLETTARGWRLSNLPFSLEEMGYPGICEEGEPNVVACKELGTVLHYVRLCERKLKVSKSVVSWK